MSRVIITGSTRDPKPDPLSDLDIDELVERLTPGEIQKLLDECDPDDPNMPPSLRSKYKCAKTPTGPLDRKHLLDFINDQALNTPDVPEAVPHVPGTLRGKKWMAPPKQEPVKELDEEKFELDIDLGDEFEQALSAANTDEIVDLAGILGLHSMMNQDQFHAAQSDKWAQPADPGIGWNGITKATPLKQYPTEAPNRTNPDEVIAALRENSPECEEVNLNNVLVSEDTFLALFDALRRNTTLSELAIANTTLTDFAAANLACALEDNSRLEMLNFESNNVSPQTLVKIFQAINVQQTVQTLKAANQQAQFLGNKVEMAITKALENNKTILKVGLHFEFGDCRNRVAVQLQKNLDRIRLKRVAQRLAEKNAAPAAPAPPPPSTGSRTGGFLGGLPGQLANIPKQKEMTPESEYEYYDETEEEEETR